MQNAVLNQLVHAEHKGLLLSGVEQTPSMAPFAGKGFSVLPLPDANPMSGAYVTSVFLQSPAAMESRKLAIKQLQGTRGVVLKADVVHGPSKCARDRDGKFFV